jgi:hypothetical protein
MSDGRLGIDQAAVVARYVPAAYSAQASELAELATVTQLRRSLARYAFADEAGDPLDQASTGDTEDTEDTKNTEAAEEAPHPGPETERPRLSMSTVDGRFELSYSAPASVGALVETAIREARDSLFHAGLVDVSLADGLAQVANRSLSTVAGSARVAACRRTSSTQ